MNALNVNSLMRRKRFFPVFFHRVLPCFFVVLPALFTVGLEKIGCGF